MTSSTATSQTLGKQRRLAQIADSAGRFALLAVDQRGNLRRALRPDEPDAVTFDEMVAFKGQVIEAIAPQVTGALLDPEFGAAQVIRTGQLPGSCGLIVALEQTGYAATPTDRETLLIDGFDARKAVKLGASAIKLLLYYHPDAQRAGAQKALVAAVAADCAVAEIPLIVEPLSFSLDSDAPLTGQARTEVVVETARVLSALDIDLLKMEFPIEPTARVDHRRWQHACEQVTVASDVPWLLLSAGVSFDLFTKQAQVACEAGASGVLVGRAVWGEATGLSGVKRSQFLRGTAVRRMAELRGIVERTAAAVSLRGGSSEEPISEGWFRHY